MNNEYCCWNLGLAAEIFKINFSLHLTIAFLYYHKLFILENFLYIKFGAPKIWRPRRPPMSPMPGAGTGRGRERKTDVYIYLRQAEGL